MDVNQFESRIGWSFNPDDLGVLLDSFADVFQVGHVNELGCHAVLVIEEFSHVSLSSSVDVVADQNVVSWLKGVQDGGSGSASAGEDDGSLSIFES